MKSRVAITGTAMTEVGRTLKKPIRDVAREVIKKAVDDAGIDMGSLDGIFVTPPGFAGPPSFMFVCNLADYLGISTRSMAMVECGGTSSAVAVRCAMNEIMNGRNKINLVFALDMRVEENLGEMERFLREAVFMQTCLYGPYDAPYGLGAPIPYYAMSAQRYMHEHGISPEDVARVAVVLRGNASRNPLAQYRKPITLEEVLSSHMISPPMHLLECSAFSSGAAALVLASEEGIKEAKGDPVWITGIGEHHHPSHFIPVNAPISHFESVKNAASEAYQDTGITPKDIDVAEVYGVFASTELILYEDLGFFKPGEAPTAVADGRTSLDGEVAMDPGGGRLSLGHPAAATPLMELVEVTWQLRGEAGERQVSTPKKGLVHAEHGMLNGSIVFIMET